MQALILAGGRGINMSPLTDEVPKALLYLPGGTILDYLLHHVTALSIRKTALVLQYRGDQIAHHLGGRSDLKLIPQNPPFTRLGALASAASWVKEPTLVFHGDYYFSRNLRASLEKADYSDFGGLTHPIFLVPERKNKKYSVSEAGAYLLPPEAFQVAAEMSEQDNLSAFYAALVQKGMQPRIIPFQGWARHIATPTDLLTVNRYLLTQWHEAMHPPEAGLGYDALNFNWIAPDADVDSNFNGLFVTIGPKASIQQSHLHNTLLMPGVKLQGANKRNSVLADSESSLLHIYSPKARSAWRSL